MNDYHQYLYSVRKRSLKDIERGKVSNEEHKLIEAAIKEKNPDLAEKRAHEHIMNALKNVMENGLDRKAVKRKA